MKKALSILTSAALSAALLVGSSVTASAASGTDVLETFEKYKTTNSMGIYWWEEGVDGSMDLSLDDTTSAPNRGDGKTKGNYRSMKVHVAPRANTQNPGWVTFSTGLEDQYAANPLLKDPNSTGTLDFYAKTEQKITFSFGIVVNEILFDADVTLEGNKWKKYSIRLSDMVCHSEQLGHGDLVDMNVLEAIESGIGNMSWGTPYISRFKVMFWADEDKAYDTTFWMDTISFTGEGISENHDVGGEDTELDRDGDVPKNFVPGTDDEEEDVTTPSNGDSKPTSKPTTKPTSKPNGGDKNPGTGAAGVSVGVIALTGLAAAAIGFTVRRKQR